MRALLSLLLALASALPAEATDPIRITGRVLHPPKDVRVELRPWAVEHGEALRRLKGETVPPIASARALADGSFALEVPEPGFYSVVARAEGHVAMERFVRFVVEDAEVPPVELAPASPLEIKALGADGLPLAGVTIQALPARQESGDWRAAGRSAVTDAEGRASFPRAPGETLALYVTSAGRYATAAADASGTVRFSAPRTRVVEIRAPDGRPAAGALVRLVRRGWPHGLAGEDGRIALPVSREDETGLLAEDSRGRRAEIVVGEGAGAHVVTLRSPARVEGRVLDASSREPVADALVWSGGSAWTRTGAGGAFEVRAPSGDQGAIEATAAGRMAHVHGWERAREGAITFLLAAAAPISGQVVDEAGKPVEGALVTTLVNPGQGGSLRMEERSASSGADGRFTIKRLPAGQLHALEAAREGFAPARRLADSTAPVRLVLRRGAAAVGRVVDEEGLPVADAAVSLAPDGEGGVPYRYQPFQAESDPDGRFRIPRVSAGRHTFRAESPGFVAAVVEDVLIPEEEPETDLGEIRLQAGGAIEGIVTDERGGPVEKAWIGLSPSGADFPTGGNAIFGRQPSFTGADGRFRVESLPRGVRYDVEVRHAELQMEEVLGVEVPTAAPLRIRLYRPRPLAGRVVDGLGEPVAGASVQPGVTTEAPDGSTRTRVEEQTRTDADGRFRLFRLSPGAVDLQVSAPGFRSRTLPVRVPEEGEADPVEIVLEAGTSLEGLVLDHDDMPVHQAHVEARIREPGRHASFSAVSDEEGRYEIVDLEPGPVEVEAIAYGQRRSALSAVEIRPGRNRLDLRFFPGSEVSGRVADGRGEPLPGATLVLEPLRQDRPSWPMQATSSADGAFAFADVSDGEYRLVASRRGFGSAVHPGEIRIDGAPVAGLELRLSRGAVIRGRILGFRPGEERSLSVYAWSEGLGFPLPGTLSPGPAYRIVDVAPGEWRVVAHASPELSVGGVAEVPEGADEVVLDLELPAGFTLTGRALLDREPLAGAEVTAAEVKGTHRRTGTTGEDGAFRVERLPAGSYVLAVALGDSLLHLRPLEVGGDLDVGVEISTGTVEGRVLLPEGLPVAGAAVALTREIPEIESEVPGPGATSDELGAFEISRVPAGTYKMTVRAEGFAPAESRLVVPPGGTVHLDVALGVSSE